MSTAIAMAPSPAPHDRPSFGADLSAPPPAPAITSQSPSSQRTAPVPPLPPLSATPNAQAPRSGSGSPKGANASATNPWLFLHPYMTNQPCISSLHSNSSRNAAHPPKIIVKKEPGSPDLATVRHRPRRLDLSRNTSSVAGSPATARPLTARESAGLGIQEVGLACLSPGFVTQDPVMKEQLQRSMSVREHQRQIIEQRLQQQSAKGDGPNHGDKDSMGNFAAKTPGLARKRGAPPGLSIVAPSHEQFANERVIQSAPLGHSFTGRHNAHPLTRHITNQPSNLASTSHIHHVPANQTNNRLPPIADVFGQGLSGHPDNNGHQMFANQSRAPLASPHHPPPQQLQQQQQAPQPTPGRPREYKSAEEAQADLAGGRQELLPKLVHYGGHQPPTPPSPGMSSQNPHAQHQRPYAEADRSASNSKRRTRAEYEEGGTPPLGNGRAAQRRVGPFGEGRDSPETTRAKKDEFLKLCAQAWDLFHS
ncbi:hypothetical protein QBC37DRAFT_283702 [Rhypophila decipiens]|uniref:Uncharacterized protein n=1 Tax=Rhypophila decipiens TaxID=261697 RepID=A0AAN6Y9B9_9PEZI|nr:hypothetical protein QBC37DRAFT_283702 [Rhypophila decipiens]